MIRTLIKQSFLASLASSLVGLSLYYLFAFWFDSDERLNIIEFLLLGMFLMPIVIGASLVFFSLYFLADYYKENSPVKNYQTFIFLLAFTGLNIVILDEAYFLVNKDVPQALVRAYKVLDESYQESGKKTIKERVDDPDFSIEEVGDYPPYYNNMISLLIGLVISSIISVAMLRRSTRKKTNEYV